MFVLIDRDMARDTGDQSTDTLPKSEAAARVVDAKDEAIRMLKDQLEAEREANRENRRIIAGSVQRVPELEATPEPRDAPETGSDLSPVVDPRATTRDRRRAFRAAPVGGVDYSPDSGIGGRERAEEVRGPHCGPHRRAGRVGNRMRIERHQHAGPVRGKGRGRSPGLPRNGGLHRGASARLSGRRVSRVRGRPKEAAAVLGPLRLMA